MKRNSPDKTVFLYMFNRGWRVWILGLGMQLCMSAGCASTVFVKTNPKNAEIALLPGRDARAQSKGLGIGEQALSGAQLKNELYRISSPGYETIYVYMADGIDKTQLDFTLPRPLLSSEGRLAQAENQVRSLSRILADLEQEKGNLQKNYHNVARLLTLAQRHLSMNSLTEAEETVNSLFEIPQEQLPGSAFTLRGKLRLLMGKRTEAAQDFERAIQVYPDDSEARGLLNSIRR